MAEQVSGLQPGGGKPLLAIHPAFALAQERARTCRVGVCSKLLRLPASCPSRCLQHDGVGVCYLHPTSSFQTDRPRHVQQTLFTALPEQPLIGCAGWSIASAQQAHFPIDGSHLVRYASVLPAVEINSSFYRPHRPETYARWRDSVPDAFRFSVKLSRSITHERRLQGIDDVLARFLHECSQLRDKLGCLLVQLPPSLQFAPDLAARFFSALRAQTSVAVVCEARHISWFSPEAAATLAQHDIGQVFAGPPATAAQLTTPSAQTVYLRLHGSPEMYHSSYSEDFLDQVQQQLRRHQSDGRTVWCIFDNTASGAALPNALSLLARFDAAR